MGQKALVAVENVAAFPVEARHANCFKGVIAVDDQHESSVLRVKPGGCIPTHLHSRIYDIFVGVEGQVDITYEGQQGDGCIALKPGGLCSMPPGVRHEVRNNSKDREAVFILIHAPNTGYDFIPAEFKQMRSAQPA